VKPRTSIVILADDLTGAAEIGAAAHQRGLATVIATGTSRSRILSEAVVHDTDSRLLHPSDAARKIVSIAARCGIADATRSGVLVLKKIDSVLRGPVLAELDTLSAISHHTRVLLVPGNPRLGRVIRDGQFYVHGEPIHRTTFGRDPHHPARSSAVADLLGPLRRGPICFLRPGEPLPPSGLIVGEASTVEDLAYWASRVGADTLAAGSSTFLEAVLEARGHTRVATAADPAETGVVLVASGTTTDTTRAVLAALPADIVPRFPMPESCTISSGPEATKATDVWAAAILGALAGHGRAVALPPTAALADPAAPGRIRAAFAAMIAELHKVQAFQHLVVEAERPRRW
jgi:D-threonate/D-erythronate kinase